MTLTPNVPTGILAGVTARRLHRLVRCWRLTLRDATVYRFTQAAHSLNVQGEVFTANASMGAFDTGTTSGGGAAGERATLTSGAMVSGVVTAADLAAGLYGGALLDVLLVDWRHPELGAFQTRSFWLTEVTWDALSWQARLVPLIDRLREPVGHLFTRRCRHELGDTGCTVARSAFRETGRAVSAVVTSRLVFRSNAANADGYHDYGKVVWLTGANAGLSHEIARYVQTNGEISLRLATPYDIAASDTFDIYAGCDKERSVCVAKFNNVVNYGGFPWLPGTDKTLQAGGQ